MEVKALALILALLVPAQVWPQAALDQAKALADGPAPADRVYDGGRYRGPSDASVVDGSGSGSKTLEAVSQGGAKKSEVEEVPNPFRPPTPKPGDPRATRGAWKGGIIGGLFGLITGLVTGWGVGAAIGGALAIGLSMGIGALLFGAAAAAIGADAGKHCAVDPQCS